MKDSIVQLRGQRVILDQSLAVMYEVETKVLLQAVKRNMNRFPADFIFQLSAEEFQYLKKNSDNTGGWGGRRYPPFAFTEQGVAMLSGVLRSSRAVTVNIEIMRAFVRLRQMLSSNSSLEAKLNELERKYDSQFRVVFQAIRLLMNPEPNFKQQSIGFRTGDKS